MRRAPLVMMIALAVLAIIPAVHTPLFAASFECGKVKAEAEKMICEAEEVLRTQSLLLVDVGAYNARIPNIAS